MALVEIYVQLSVNYAGDPKVAALARFGKDARPARDLYVQMFCYAKAQMTDGVVPIEEMGKLVYPDSSKVADRQSEMLVEVGLIVAHERGWFVPAYLKRNKSKAEIVAQSEALAAVGSAAGSFGNHQRWHVKRGVNDLQCQHCTSGTHRVDPIGGESGNQIGSHRTETKTETETKETSEAAPRPDIERICERLRDRITANGSKAPSINAGWRDSARLLIDRDKRPLTEIMQLIAWSQDHDFWRANIQSMPTFRAKYDQLRLQREREVPAQRSAGWDV